MIDRDDRLLKEAYEEIEEGWLQRSDAKTGTRGKGIQAGLMSAAGKMLGNKLGGGITAKANQMRGEVDKQRLQQLMAGYKGELDKLITSITTDVEKLGGDVANIQENDPSFPGIKYLMNALNNAVKAADVVQGQAQAQTTGKMAAPNAQANNQQSAQSAPIQVGQ